MAEIIPYERCVDLASLTFSCLSKRNRPYLGLVLPSRRWWSLIGKVSLNIFNYLLKLMMSKTLTFSNLTQPNLKRLCTFCISPHLGNPTDYPNAGGVGASSGLEEVFAEKFNPSWAVSYIVNRSPTPRNKTRRIGWHQLKTTPLSQIFSTLSYKRILKDSK